MKRPVIGVMGSGTEPHAALAGVVGRFVAECGAHLLTGGGQGVMAAVSEAFTTTDVADRGLCLGVVPCRSATDRRPKPGYPNRFVELPVLTHLWLSGDRGRAVESRNAINVLTADAVIALPGGAGTISEVELALEFGKPVVLFCSDAREVAAFPAEAARISDPGALRDFLEPFAVRSG